MVSFRPGELSNPFGLPQALRATRYLYSSTATANDSLTHLPYQLNYDRLTNSEVEVFEFPVTLEDEELPKMGDRLPQALEVARQVSRYGGLCVILIHPNILDHKLGFEKGFVEGVRPYAWFGSVSQFGQWWGCTQQCAGGRGERWLGLCGEVGDSPASARPHTRGARGMDTRPWSILSRAH